MLDNHAFIIGAKPASPPVSIAEFIAARAAMLVEWRKMVADPRLSAADLDLEEVGTGNMLRCLRAERHG